VRPVARRRTEMAGETGEEDAMKVRTFVQII